MAVFRISSDLLQCYEIQRLDPRAFRRLFAAALAGEPNVFSPFVRPGGERPSPSAWARLRAAVFARDDYTCAYCGRRGVRLECDHVLPVARGGSHDPDNLVTACFVCNRSKHDKTVEEWLA